MKFLKIFTVSFCFFLANAVYAHPPQPNIFDNGNLWAITGYWDESPAHTEAATQLICFSPYVIVGTQIRGSWYSLSFPDWNGNYAQEGDQLFLHGDFGKNYGHDGMIFDIGTNSQRNMALGHWKEWFENPGFGVTVAFGNARLTRLGNKCDVINEQQLPSLNIPPRLLVNGGEARSPAQEGQVPLDSTLLK